MSRGECDGNWHKMSQGSLLAKEQHELISLYTFFLGGGGVLILQGYYEETICTDLFHTDLFKRLMHGFSARTFCTDFFNGFLHGCFCSDYLHGQLHDFLVWGGPPEPKFLKERIKSCQAKER